MRIPLEAFDEGARNGLRNSAGLHHVAECAVDGIGLRGSGVHAIQALVQPRDGGLDIGAKIHGVVGHTTKGVERGGAVVQPLRQHAGRSDEALGSVREDLMAGAQIRTPLFIVLLGGVWGTRVHRCFHQVHNFFHHRDAESAEKDENEGVSDFRSEPFLLSRLLRPLRSLW